MNAPTHPINVFWWSAKDGASVADVPFCSATGDTPHDAVA
jgi:predicted RNase H-like HicB family nuclease